MVEYKTRRGGEWKLDEEENGDKMKTSMAGFIYLPCESDDTQ